MRQFLFLLKIFAFSLVTLGASSVYFEQTANANMVGLVQRILEVNYGTPPGLERERKFLRFPIVQDELLETSAQGGLSVEFLDETTLTLGPGSSLIIDSYVFDPNAKQATTILNRKSVV